MSINRVVTILTPLVFAPAASVVVGLVARYFPGLPTPDPAEIVALEGAAFLSAVGIAGKWLHGQSKWETMIKQREQFVEELAAHKAAFPAVSATNKAA